MKMKLVLVAPLLVLTACESSAEPTAATVTETVVQTVEAPAVTETVTMEAPTVTETVTVAPPTEPSNEESEEESPEPTDEATSDDLMSEIAVLALENSWNESEDQELMCFGWEYDPQSALDVFLDGEMGAYLTEEMITDFFDEKCG